MAPHGARARPSSRNAVADPAAVALADVSRSAWRDLAAQAIEPNGYYLADWMQAVDASSRVRSCAKALTVTRTGDPSRLIGLLPVVSLWRAYHIPLPALVTADPYGTLCTPLLDRETAAEAAAGLLAEARRAGAHALVLRDSATDGPALRAMTAAATADGFAPIVLHSHERACLDATRGFEDVLRDALGAKKLKELRRQRNRLADHGEVRFEVATTPDDVASALAIFLDLEASGWKARRGTALNQHAGDAAFIRSATIALAARRQCEIVTLRAGEQAVASGVVLRHLDRAFFFKLGVDPAFARYSVGVQLTIELTRHLCEDPQIRLADSTAIPGHPMIEPIWRGRLAIGDVLVPLYRNDPAVSAIRLALNAHRALRSRLRQAVHMIRNRKEKNQ